MGERSVSGLARLIQKDPDVAGAPGDCVSKNAEKVAAYIYAWFAPNPPKRINNFQPSRIELSRLTVRQYRNAIADLFGSFKAPLAVGIITDAD